MLPDPLHSALLPISVALHLHPPGQGLSGMGRVGAGATALRARMNIIR